MEIELEARIFQVRMLCDACTSGEMLPAGLTLTVNPPLFQHECNNCGKKEYYGERYPFNRTKLMDKEE